MDWLMTVGAAAGALVALGALIRGAWRVNRRIVRIADAVTELYPNEGHSIRDRVVRMDEGFTDLAERFENHLRNHPGS